MKKQVQFFEPVEKCNKGRIVVNEVGVDNLIADLGFLKCFMQYRIEIFVPESLAHITETFCKTPAHDENCSLNFVKGEDDGSVLFIDIVTNENELVTSELMIQNASQPIKLKFIASVIGPDKGTPMLRNGIHTVGRRQNSFGEESMETT